MPEQGVAGAAIATYVCIAYVAGVVYLVLQGAEDGCQPLFMLALMLVLPPLSGGQIMIWWGTVFARILFVLLALVIKRRADGQIKSLDISTHKYYNKN